MEEKNLQRQWTVKKETEAASYRVRGSAAEPAPDIAVIRTEPVMTSDRLSISGRTQRLTASLLRPIFNLCLCVIDTWPNREGFLALIELPTGLGKLFNSLVLFPSLAHILMGVHPVVIQGTRDTAQGAFPLAVPSHISPISSHRLGDTQKLLLAGQAIEESIPSGHHALCSI